MADTMKGLKRTHYCTEVTTADIGKEVVVAGFTQKQRDKGELVFIDLRDRTGIRHGAPPGKRQSRHSHR